jgi:hypothetical protein
MNSHAKNLPSLNGMSFTAAFRMAVAFSGKTEAEIAASMGWSQHVASRIFYNGDYWPALPNVPRLCEILGNMIIAQWIFENSSVLVRKAKPADKPFLMENICRMLKEMSEVMAQAQQVLNKDEIGGKDARRLIRETLDLMKVTAEMLAGLQAVIDEEKGL